MSASKPTRDPNWKRKPDWLLKFLTEQSRGRLVASLVIVYVLPIFIFAVLYTLLDVLRENDSPVQNYGQALFFSSMIESTSGFVGITTTGLVGRSLVAAQVLIGVSSAAFLPAIILIRLTSPDTRSVYFARKMAFNPDTGQFAIRYASFSRLLIFNTNLTVWARIPAPKSGDWNNLPVRVRSSIESNRRFGNIRPETPFIVYTDPNRAPRTLSENIVASARHLVLGDTLSSIMPPENIQEIFLDPAHFRGFETEENRNEAIVTIDIAGDTSAGTVHAFHAYRYDDIICGYPVNVQDPHGPKIWKNLNEFVNKTASPDGQKNCLKCRYHPTCNLVNKSKGAP